MKMSCDQGPNVRLVRCPKCRKLLPESPNVLLYRCGGCGAILQAKVRRNNTSDSKTGVPQTDLAQLNKLEQDKRIGSSGKNVVSPTEAPSLIQNNETSHNGSGSCTRELPEDRNFQIEVPSSLELTHHSSSPSSPEMNATVEPLEERKFPKRVPSSAELTQYSSDLSSSVTAASRDENINFSDEFPSSAELSHHSSDPLSPAMDASCKVDEADDSTSKSRNGKSDQILITSANSLIDSADTPASEIISSNLPLDPAAEQLQNSKQRNACLSGVVESKLTMETGEVTDSSKSLPQGIDRSQSTDTVETEDAIDPFPKLNGARRDFSKSPTTRSAYTYDGSISSDGTEDQVLNKHKRTFNDEEFLGHEVRADFPMDSFMDRQSEIHQDAWSFSSLVDKPYLMRQSSWGSRELLEPMGYPIRDRVRADVGRHPSKAPLDPEGDQARYEYGGPSNHWYDDIRSNSSPCSSKKLENPEQERLKLLRMVYDLQDQLHRTKISQGKSNNRGLYTDLWSANHVPSYVSQEAAAEEMHHGLNYSCHLNERHGQWRNWSPYSTSSQMSCLGEASHSGLQVDPSCLRCNAQKAQCSMQLPYPVCCCKNDLHGVHLHPGGNFYNPHSCFLSGPHQYIESDVPPNFHDMKSGDQRHEERYVEYEKPLHSRLVKHPVGKPHLPIAGAAPFVACYSCKNVLQIPADFLLFGRRFHQLRCGACSKILKFSFRKNTHILPYFWCTEDLPSGEFDSGSDTFYWRNYASANELNSSSAPPDPISCSEDSGFFSRRSLSTETEQLHHLEGYAHNRKISRSSLESAEGRKKLISKQSPSESKSLLRPSSNMLNGEKLSSEVEEKRPTSGSPLHRLMGYSSISQVVRGSGNEASSTFSREEKN